VQLGSAVVVLPWHDPVRVAEQLTMLDLLSGGRVLFGMGRGLGRVEFEGFRLEMDQARERFIESAQMILSALENGTLDHDGTHIHQPARPLRPAPARSFRGRVYAAAQSPESMGIMAELGVGLLVIPQKPWESTETELAEYRRVYLDVNGTTAPPPVVMLWTFVDRDADRAAELAHHHLGNYFQSVLRHYEMAGDHFAATKGYDYYVNVARTLQRHGAGAGSDMFTDLHVWGTPEQCIERVADIRRRTGASHVVAVSQYGGMPYDEGERNLRLFASEVMPALRELPEHPGFAAEPTSVSR
jgi:alkanesulfonate monooxygenase SsuD/methylene tetrahydromethanopterin reductase-like flavin-dependent oxidoreductase (luciferase family)